jgi:hypothetical protein
MLTIGPKTLESGSLLQLMKGQKTLSVLALKQLGRNKVANEYLNRWLDLCRNKKIGE